MVLIEYKKQSGQNAKSPKFTFTDAGEKASITALINEATEKGRAVEVISTLLENSTDKDVYSITLGFGSDSVFSDISANIVYQKFFSADRDYYAIAVTNNGDSVIELNCGTSSGGTEVFSGESIAAGQRKLIPISVSPTVDSAAYFWSSDWGGNTVNIKSHSDEA